MALTRKTPPTTRVRSAGRVSKNMDGLGDIYRSKNPDMDVRWVYDPQHRPELSNVTARQVEGYVLVYGREFEGENFQLDADKPVRHGDTVLMAMPRELRDQLMQDRAEVAKEELKSIDRNFYESIDSIPSQTGDPKHKARPRGSTTIQEKTVEFDYTNGKE